MKIHKQGLRESRLQSSYGDGEQANKLRAAPLSVLATSLLLVISAFFLPSFVASFCRLITLKSLQFLHCCRGRPTYFAPEDSFFEAFLLLSDGRELFLGDLLSLFLLSPKTCTFATMPFLLRSKTAAFWMGS